jgi:transposase-like protein
MARSYAELMGLEVEAERLVRCGESRAEVARRLGVHPQTLATWALRGGWRKKDLDLERSAEASRETILAIRHGNAQVDAQRAMREQVRAAMREAVALLAEGSAGSLRKLERMIGGIETPKRLEAPKVVLGPDPKMGHWKSLGENDVDTPRDPIVDENGDPWTPEIEAARIREMRSGGGRPGRRRRR